MLILGLGSNLGNRLANLKLAFHALKKMGGLRVLAVSPVYLSEALVPDNAPDSWNKSYLNLALGCETNLDPHALLCILKKIEAQLGRDLNAERWAPRLIDIDILAWDKLVLNTDDLTIPHPRLLERPFALWPLADIAATWQYPVSGVSQHKTAAELVEAWGSRYSANSPLRTRQINHRIDTPELVGIINATNDSFSDGGKYLQIDKAIEQVISLANAGATIIDIGAESTAPSAKAMDEKTEWLRLEPILSVLQSHIAHCAIQPRISVDTRHANVAEKALQYSIDWINDVTGLDDPMMCEVVRASQKECVIMHHLSIPEDRANVLSRNANPVSTVFKWGQERLALLEKRGLNIEKIIFDPGIGFGKLAEQSILLLKNAGEFKKLGIRVLIGHSRKTFMNNLTYAAFANRDLETAVIALALLPQEIDYLRVHDVDSMARGIRAWKSIT